MTQISIFKKKKNIGKAKVTQKENSFSIAKNRGLLNFVDLYLMVLLFLPTESIKTKFRSLKASVQKGKLKESYRFGGLYSFNVHK